MFCGECGKTHNKIIKSMKFGKILCSPCYQMFSAGRGRDVLQKPDYGEVKYDEAGKPICHICGRAYSKLLAHVWQKHDMSEAQYKETFGLDATKGIMSPEAKNKCRVAVMRNYEKAIKDNLVVKGAGTRFEQGCEGRTRDKIREQTLKKLKMNRIYRKKSNDK
jgi:hypothetical protein